MPLKDFLMLHAEERPQSLPQSGTGACLEARTTLTHHD